VTFNAIRGCSKLSALADATAVNEARVRAGGTSIFIIDLLPQSRPAKG
jgi:hypothetical protein